MMSDVSKRLVEQNCRTSIAQALDLLVRWEWTLRNLGFAEYFNWFFDWFPDKAPPHPNSAMTPQEYAAVSEVQALMIEACDDTGGDMTVEAYRATGWPQKIAVAADHALQLILRRGRFSGEKEELEPSAKFTGEWASVSPSDAAS